MKKKSVIVLIISLLATVGVFSQKLTTSPFSRYGVGEILFAGNGRQRAMGNTGIGNYTSYHISALNPASISALKPNSVIFEVGLFHKLSVFDNGEATQINNASNFSYIMGGFRVARFWHTSFGILPYSGIGYKVQTTDTLSIDNSVSPITVNYEGAGGINRFYWTNSFNFLGHFNIGATINYNFGTFDRQSSTVISDSVYMSIAAIADKNLFHKFSYNFGFIFADTIFRNEKNILKYSLGGIYSNKYEITSLERRLGIRSVSAYNRAFSDTIFMDTVGTSTMMMPQTIGVGASFTLLNSYTFNFDYMLRKWSGNSIFNQNNFVDSRFMGVGFEYCRNPFSTIYGKTIRYRIGAYQYDSYVLFNNKQIQTQAITLGVGFPIKTIQMNLGFTIGQTGDISLGLKENFYQFNLGISLYDIWFIKRKFM